MGEFLKYQPDAPHRVFPTAHGAPFAPGCQETEPEAGPVPVNPKDFLSAYTARLRSAKAPEKGFDIGQEPHSAAS